MRPRRQQRSSYTLHSPLPVLILFLAACAPEKRQAQIQQDPTFEEREPSQSTQQTSAALPGEIVGRPPLFKEGALRKIRAYDLMPEGILHDLSRDWRRPDQQEYFFPLWSPHRGEYDLIYEDNCRKAWITQVVDLRWKVEVLSEEQASQFADLTGAFSTAIFPRDLRGLEVLARNCFEDSGPYCTIGRRDFEKLGLKPRQIEQLATGFIIRRPLYQPAQDGKPARLIESREFVSADGLYIFGIDREVLKGNECSIVIDGRDQHDLMATFHYRALFGWPRK